MGSNHKTMSREERLAAKLRENLRRRKAQKKAQSGTPTRPRSAAGDAPLSKDEPKS